MKLLLVVLLELTIFPLRTDFERFTPHVWELHKKQAITAESLAKIEDGKGILLSVWSPLLKMSW